MTICGDGKLVDKMWVGCGENVDLVPTTYPHFHSPPIVQQHRHVGLVTAFLEVVILLAILLDGSGSSAQSLIGKLK